MLAEQRIQMLDIQTPANQMNINEKSIAYSCADLIAHGQTLPKVI